MEYIFPKRLIPGKSTIGLIAPSGVVVRHELEAGLKILKDWGFSVRLGKNVIAKSQDYSAGSEDQRSRDLIAMMTAPDVDAIGCIVGGFAASGIIKVLDDSTFEAIRKSPKIFFGFSDFSQILNALFSKGFASLHAPNLSGLYNRSLDSLKCLKLSLLGDLPAEIGPMFGWETVQQGFVKGRLLVSNLESLIHVLGTPFDPLNAGDEPIVLAVEEVGENKSTIARWLDTLLNHVNAKRIQGIVLGRFTKIGEKDYPAWGLEFSVERIFQKAFGAIKVPIASLPVFGHIEEQKGLLKRKGRERTDFLSLPTGVRVMYKVKPESCRLTFLEKGIE